MCKIGRAIREVGGEIAHALGGIAAELRLIRKSLGDKMTELTDAVNDLGGWGTSWRERALAAEAIATEAVEDKEASDAALAAFIANDAETDLQQLADNTAANTAVVRGKLDELKAQDPPAAEPPPVEEPPVDPPVDPPVEEPQA